MSPVGDERGLDGHAAFLALHRHAGNVPPDTMGVARVSVGEALDTLTASEDVADSARLDVLVALAAADFPDYEGAEEQYVELAARVASRGDLDAEQLLTDLKADAMGDMAFLASASGLALPHTVTAFFKQDVCHSFRVNVNGKQAVWLFSEFETDAPFKSAADWVDPRNWPQRSPMVFKSMQPVAGPLQQLPGLEAGQQSWHGDFEELVELVTLVRTELHCDFTRVDGLFAGSTYELVRSVDGEIDVDRGFLLVNDLGRTRNVKCLKVVGFTNDYWDDQALHWACLSWTQFVRAAVEGGTQSEPTGPQRPQGGYTLEDAAVDWFDCLGAAGRKYLDMGLDWSQRAVGGGYALDDAVTDTARLWLAIAQDWANASAEIYANLSLLSAGATETSVADAIFAAWLPGSPGQPAAGMATAAGAAPAAVAATVLNQGFSAATPGFEGATLPWDGLDAGDQLTCTDLTRLGAAATVVPASQISLSTVAIGNGYGAHLEVPVATLRPGLYIGKVAAGNKGQRSFQVYVSRATGGPGGR